MNESDRLLGALPVLQRLALAYAPASARLPTLALLALDTRLAGIVRAASEPMLAQLRLAWWREQLDTDMASWPEGEPLLAVLRSWQGGQATLVRLVDGWEYLTGNAPLPASALEHFAEARGQAFAALAGRLGLAAEAEAALRLGRNWALADMAARLSHTEEKAAAQELARGQDWRRARLSRGLRPLTVLHGLAARGMKQGRALDNPSPADLAAALRLGLLGR